MNMNKELFLKLKTQVNNEISDLQAKLKDYRLNYIHANKPCSTGDSVTITLSSGRKVKGEVISFGILKDQTVCITAYAVENRVKYITTPHKDVIVNTKNK